jgi:hypothetical protein
MLQSHFVKLGVCHPTQNCHMISFTKEAEVSLASFGTHKLRPGKMRYFYAVEEITNTFKWCQAISLTREFQYIGGGVRIEVD